jgi:hypothetical protein
MKRPLVLFFALILSSPAAWALETLKGKEAAGHVGDAKEHFADKGYTYEILKRSHRDSMHGRFSDGVIFNPGGGPFHYVRRKDGDHVIRIDDPEGREEEAVSEANWNSIQNTLSDDSKDAVVFLDDTGKEMAVVYIGRGTKLEGKTADSGHLELSLSVDGAGSGKQSRGRRKFGF